MTSRVRRVARGAARVVTRTLLRLLLAVYLLVSRTIAFVGAAYLLLYFLVGTRAFKDVAQELVASAIPGTITAASVQWGPAPWQIRIADGRVLGKDGEEVLHVDALVANLEVLPTLVGLFRFATEDDAPFRLLVRHADVGRGHVDVRVDEDGNVGIERAFVDHDAPPGTGPPLRFDIRARTVSVVQASGHVATPDVVVDGDGVDASVRAFSISGFGHVAFEATTAHVAHATLALSPWLRGDGGLEPARLESSGVDVAGFAWNGLTFTWRHATGRGDGLFYTGSGGFDVAATPVTWQGDLHVRAPRGSPWARAVAGDAIPGPFDLSLRGAGSIEQAYASFALEAPAMNVLGASLSDVRVLARAVPRGTADEPRAHELLVDQLSATAFGGGHVDVVSASVGPEGGGAGARPLAVTANVVGSDVAAKAVLEWLDLPDVPPLAGARLRGPVTVAGTIAPGRLSLEVQSDGLAIGVPEGGGVVAPGQYDLVGALRWDDALPAPGDEDLLGTQRLELARVSLDGEGNRVNVQGVIDIARGTLDLEPYARLGDVRQEARRLGMEAGGRLVLKAAHLGGTLASPRLTGTLSWSGARVAGVELGRVTGGLALADGALSMSNVHAASALGVADLDGHVRLFADGFAGVDPRMPFEVTRFTAKSLALGGLVPDLELSALFDVKRATFRGDLADPAGTLAGKGATRATNVDLAGEHFTELACDFEADASRVSLDRVALTTREGRALTGSVALERASGRVHGSLRTSDLPLSSIAAIRRAAPTLKGRVSANLSFGGTLDQPSLIGHVELAQVRVGPAELGSADVDVQTLPSGRIDLSSTRFLPGFELVDGSGLEIARGKVAALSIGVHAKGARLGQIVPSLASGGVELTTSGTASLAVPGAGARPYDLVVTADPGEVQLTLKEQRLSYVNGTRLELRAEDGGLVLAPVLVGRARALSEEGGGPTTASALELCGALSPRGALEAQLRGTVDLALLRGLKDVFSLVEGKVRVGADPVAARAIQGARCLTSDGEDDAVMRIAGDLGGDGGLAVTGRLEPVGVTIIPRNLRRELRLADGAGVFVRPGKGAGELRLVAPEDAPVRGEVDDGSFSVTGEIDLVGMAPETIDARVVGTDLFYASPGEFSATFNPTLHVTARDFRSAAPDTKLEGTVHITEGHYTKSFDTFARALGAAIGGAHDVYSKPVTEELPWLRSMKLALDVTSSNFSVQSAFPLGKSDMEARLDLSVAGTVDDLKVYRRIDLLPGGTVTYRVFRRDFEIVGGWVDFNGDADHPTIDVTAQTQVSYLARASSESQDEDEKIVVITLRISGRVPDLSIALSSDDSSLDQDDLQSLVLTGRPRRELDRASGASLFTADLAGLVNEALKSPFVKTVSVGLGAEGDVRADVGTCFGPDLCITGTAVQETTETTLRARFRLRLGDDVTCDGTLRRSDTSTRSTVSNETYEARCRYRIPLE
ncbi:MAG: translocation/assembly module TamB domain-containing protein [Myxococcales bacterium]|nr:translocation/assembly module TamB domain-containing protein [Myxococcales bacterium]MCB9732883.1 translocation/assembly module TamB domain-containing protein [Deltaproteobacteria bacterium]